MVKIHGSRDCGNSPKNSFVQEIAITLEAGTALPDGFSDKIIWHRNCDEQADGPDAIRRVLESQETAAEIIVEHAISHVSARCGPPSFSVPISGHLKK